MLTVLLLLFVLWLGFKLSIAFWKILCFVIGFALILAFVSSLVIPLLVLFAIGGTIWAIIR